MSLKHTFDCLVRNYRARPDEPKPSLRQIFANQGKLSSQVVHIVYPDTLKQLAELNHYNNDLYKNQGRRGDFLPFLLIENCQPDSLFFIIADDQNRFIASMTLHPVPDEPQRLQLSQISVHKNYQNMGLATRMLDTAKTYLNKDRRDITEIIVTSFEEDGTRWLRPKCLDMSEGLKAQVLRKDNHTGDLIPLGPMPE